MPEAEAPKTPIAPEAGSVTDTAKTDKPAEGSAVDLSKLSDEQIQQLIEDKRLLKHAFEHPRFKELSEQAKAGRAAQEAAKKAEEEKLKKAGEFDTILAERDNKIKSLTDQMQRQSVDNKLTQILFKEESVDADTALQIIDRSKIVVAEDGTVSGLEEAVKALKESKPFLFGKAQAPKVGGATNPKPGDVNGQWFNQSQLADPKFYKENRESIMEAMNAGRIRMGQ